MSEYLQDPEIWIVVSFVIFVVMLLKFGRTPAILKLDAKIAEIRRDIETAASLRQEAQDLLALYEKKQQEAQTEARAIIENAKMHAAEIRKQADTEREELLKRREQQITERLQRMEAAAIQEIRSYAAELAVRATTEIIAGKMDEQTNARLVEESSKHLAGQLS